MWHERKRGEVHMWLWGGNLKERYHLEDLDVDWEIIMEWILKKSVEKSRNGRIGLRVGASGGFL
jgi:hypothetical protein